MKVLALTTASLAALVLGWSAAPPAATEPGQPALSFPLACEPGRTCEIQHYVDRDPGPGTRDYRCGLQTYDRHQGIDIRLPDMAAQRRGVAVLAAAAGRVTRLRDGVQDISIRAPGAPSVANQECGNAVVVDHGNGWETQYCHMARGSLVVKVGDSVTAGAPLGRVGLSGNTEFPHLHMSVRHAGQVVDPFAPDMSAPQACKAQTGLWTAQALARMTYRSGAVLNAGFTSARLGPDGIENGGLPRVSTASPMMIAYVRAIALQPGDTIELVLKGPDGATLAQSRKPPLERWRAQDWLYVGQKRPATGWPRGTYVADYRVWRQGKVAISRRLAIKL